MPRALRPTCLFALGAAALLMTARAAAASTPPDEERAERWRQRYAASLAPEDLLQEALAWQQAGRCQEATRAAQRYLTLLETPPTGRHLAMRALIDCQRDQLPDPAQLRAHSSVRANLQLLRRLIPLRQQLHQPPSPAQLAAWSITGEGLAQAAASTLHPTIDLEPRAQALDAPSNASGRLAEARRRISAQHWIIPTLYSISGVVTRDGLVIYDEQLRDVEARLLPIYRAGGFGARIRIQF